MDLHLTAVVQLFFVVLALAAVANWFFPGLVFERGVGPAPTARGFFILCLEILALGVFYLLIEAVLLGKSPIASVPSPFAAAGLAMLGITPPPPQPEEPDPLEPKKWWESRTAWLNGLAALGIVLYGGAQIITQDSSGLDPRIITFAGLVVTIGNVYLRSGTTAPIAGSRAQKKVDRALVQMSLRQP